MNRKKREWYMGKCSKGILVAFLVCGSVQQSRATIACPVSLVDGKAGENDIVLSFRNKGKLPIQQLEFDCTPSRGSKAHRLTCHQETGLFFPGTTYTSSFAYHNRAGSILVSLEAARLSDGSFWTSKRDQRCPALRIDHKRRP
jgi:hypothetical protein